MPNPNEMSHSPEIAAAFRHELETRGLDERTTHAVIQVMQQFGLNTEAALSMLTAQSTSSAHQEVANVPIKDRELSSGIESLPELRNVAELAYELQSVVAEFEAAHSELKADETWIIPSRFAKLINIERVNVYDYLKSDNNIVTALKLTDPSELRLDNQEKIKASLQEFLHDNFWQTCSSVLSLNEYMSSYAAKNTNTEHQALVGITRRLAELFKQIYSQAGTSLSEIELFKTTYNADEHNIETLPDLLWNDKAYQSYVETLANTGQLPIGAICEIQGWGYDTDNPQIGKRKARVIIYHPEDASDIFRK